MDPSLLKLRAYHLKSISIVPYDEVEPLPLGQYADFNAIDFTSEVQYYDFKDDGADADALRHGLSLKLTAHRGQNNSFPYAIDLEMVGVFDASALPDEKRVPMVLVNGSSMLYGALREILLNLTHRCMHGPVLLPSVHFVQLERDYLKSKATHPKTDSGPEVT